MLLVTTKDGRSLKYDPAAGDTEKDFERMFGSIRNEEIARLEATQHELVAVLRCLRVTRDVMRGMELFEEMMLQQSGASVPAGKAN